MPITKRPCANCPFRSDGAGVELEPGRVDEKASAKLIAKEIAPLLVVA